MTDQLLELRNVLNKTEAAYQDHLRRNVAGLSLQEQVENDLAGERLFNAYYAASQAYKAALRGAAQ